MNAARRLQHVRRLGIAVVALTVVLMILGSWVKATGSGLSCPDWPQCYGQWLPPFPSAENGGIDPDAVDAADAYTQAQVLYEWTHRLVASILGVPLIAFAVLAFRGQKHHPALRWLPVAALGILVVQVGLGGITVIGKNAAPLTTAHLATATFFLVTITVAACFAWLRPWDDRPDRPRKPKKAKATPAQPRVRRPHEMTKFPGED